MEKVPAFQFYPKDWQTDERVKLMSHTERGMYIDLLCHCWLEGSLPAEVKDIAKLVHVQSGRFELIWAGALGQCFYRKDDGRHGQKRLDAERVKQDNYRRRQSDKGKASVEARFNRGSTAVNSRLEPKDNSSSSSSVSTFHGRRDDRSKRPIFTGQRLTVFEWNLSDALGILGDHAEAFDLHSWFFDLDERMRRDGLIQPKRDSGAWFQSEVVAEAQRRGIAVRVATPVQPGKLTSRLGAALSNIAKETA